MECWIRFGTASCISQDRMIDILKKIAAVGMFCIQYLHYTKVCRLHLLEYMQLCVIHQKIDLYVLGKKIKLRIIDKKVNAIDESLI